MLLFTDYYFTLYFFIYLMIHLPCSILHCTLPLILQLKPLCVCVCVCTIVGCVCRYGYVCVGVRESNLYVRAHLEALVYMILWFNGLNIML